ncbi:MAG: hypothetical protein HYV07_24020 [Deltaproteobacteria bacterium]|nr:hypothetical protein [Deltaproteobacteria bacterium]
MGDGQTEPSAEVPSTGDATQYAWRLDLAVPRRVDLVAASGEEVIRLERCGAGVARGLARAVAASNVG